MRSTSWLTDARHEMAVELHRELEESGVSSVRRRLKGSAPVAVPSLPDAGTWDEQTPVDVDVEEETEPEALWRALADLEAEVVEQLRGPSWQWPETDWGMPVRPTADATTNATQPDRLAANARAARRLAHGTADPTLPQPAFDVLATARRAPSYVVLARREAALPAKATSRPTILSSWEMPAQASTRWSAIKLVAMWLIGLALVGAGLVAAGLALP